MSQYHSYVSCSIAEIYGAYIGHDNDTSLLKRLTHAMYREPTAEDATSSIGFIATQYRGTIADNPKKYKHKNGDEGQYLGPKAFFLWSDHDDDHHWGPKFARQLVNLGLAEVTKTGPTKNPCTRSSDICVWVAKLNQDALKAWYNEHGAKGAQ